MSTDPTAPVARCVCCGGRKLSLKPALWPELIDAWQLTPAEVACIDRQQGLRCAGCGANLRSMALAHAVMDCFGRGGLFKDFVRTWSARRLKVLELNPAGTLSGFLQTLKHHTLARYPAVDMMALPYPDRAFDLVLHADDLEHIADPVKALRECRRVLRPGGFCCFTVPMVVGRLTRSRQGLPASYHGAGRGATPDVLVHTEYGADTWRHVVEAGFGACRIVFLEYPAAGALAGEAAG